jgi:MHS family citrate/tricarballylate:H+ symporter-like MFS transporter
MLIATRVLFVAGVFPAFSILTSPHATPQTILVTNLILSFVFATTIGAVYAFLAEAFPQSVRSSGLAILYALGVSIFGGTTQFVVAWLIEATGDPMVPAYYQIVANMAGIIGVSLLVPDAEVARERAAQLVRA